jgi:ribonucleoside-diphosphate reductase alpha chain
MISIDINHPDVEEFINIKANTDQITNANISVRVNDAFMKAVENDEDYYLRWPCDSMPEFDDPFHKQWMKENPKKPIPYNELLSGKDGDDTIYWKKVKARDLFYKLAKNNWNYAEPGILYWNRIDHWNMMDKNEEFKYAGVNPCAKFKFILIF